MNESNPDLNKLVTNSPNEVVDPIAESLLLPQWIALDEERRRPEQLIPISLIDADRQDLSSVMARRVADFHEKHGHFKKSANRFFYQRLESEILPAHARQNRGLRNSPHDLALYA